MRTYHLVAWIAASAAMVSFGAFASTDPEIGLKEAFRSALEKTETVPIGGARIRQSEARVDQAKSRFLPNLSFGASVLQQESGFLARDTSSLFGGAQSYTRLTLSQSIYEGGRDRANLRANESNLRAERQNLSSANYGLFTNVAHAFYGVLSNQREVENLKVSIEIAGDRVREIRDRTKIGKSRNVELLAAQAQLSVLDSELLAAEGALVTAWDQFVLITGLPRDVKLTQKRETPAVPKAIDEYVSLIEKRPDVLSMKAQIEQAENEVGIARAGHFPSIELSGNFYPTRNGAQEGNHWDVGATLALPIFSGGLVSAQVREASERRAEAETTLAQTRRQAEITVRTAYNSLESSLNQIKALESALSSTEQNYKQQAKNYLFGQATNLDVIQALNTFLDTKRSLDRTRYLALAAWADLKAATAQVSLADVKGSP